MLFFILLIVVFVILIFFKMSKKKQEKKIFEKYSCEEGNFVVKGRKDQFKVIKNGNIEFMVKDGQIVASRDLRIGRDYVYYGGTIDGITK